MLASGADVNVLVLDTEVYSNTGGQSSKATPPRAVAKFATGGKPTAKKDLGLVAMSYGNVYVAQIAMGANDLQTVKALTEAEAWPGPSLVIAYSTCIAHGIDMSTSMTHQKDAVRSGYWPLFRYHPGAGEHEHPFRLDAHDPTIELSEFTSTDGRFAGLARSDPSAPSASWPSRATTSPSGGGSTTSSPTWSAPLHPTTPGTAARSTCPDAATDPVSGGGARRSRVGDHRLRDPAGEHRRGRPRRR